MSAVVTIAPSRSDDLLALHAFDLQHDGAARVASLSSVKKRISVRLRLGAE
jgi:hypothetical protein